MKTTLQGTLSASAAEVLTRTPKAGYDKPEVEKAKEAGREQFKKDQEFLVKVPVIMEKLLFRVYDIFSKSKEDSSILQACVMRDLPYCDNINQSLFTSARALYLMGQTDILDFEKFTNKSGHTYFKIKAGVGFPTDSTEIKRVAKKAAKKNKRLVSDIMFTKITRNNKNGFFTFEEDRALNMNAAINKLHATLMRLYIPEGMTYEQVALGAMGKEADDVLLPEVISELEKFDGKTFHVAKSGDRSARIYGFKHLDITAKSSFRPHLRLQRKRKITAAGLKAYNKYLEAERDDLPQWFITELEGLRKGDFTNIMVEIDGNNQGPSIVAAILQDKEQFLKYWDRKDSKMYEEFKDSILTKLGLPLDTLVSKDVKYKIMTKPYNKMDESNVFGGKSFIEKIENSATPGLDIAKYDFYELPLKLQLQLKLGGAYNIEDKILLDIYKQAVLEVAPFLEQFKLIMDDFQDNCKYTPSIWEWDGVDGDAIMCARSCDDSIKVEFYDIFGGEHSFTYQYSRVLLPSEWGGWTSLSPTFIASIDAWIARQLIILFGGDIFSNHDAFFVHGNDELDVIAIYKQLFVQIPDYANQWLRAMGKKYMNTRINDETTFFFLASFGRGVEPLTSDEILSAHNLVGN